MYKKYNLEKLDFSKIRTYPIAKRNDKVTVSNFSNLDRYRQSGNLRDLFPDVLKGGEFLELVDRIRSAQKKKRPVLLAMGAHVIKCGLSPLVNDLVERGFVTGIVLNGAGAIHDFEVADFGKTSETVEEGIGSGTFGMVKETAEWMNQAIETHCTDDAGLGYALGKALTEAKPPHEEYSILARGFLLNRPVTVHVAVGTDTTHIHPTTSGETLGRGSMNDFRLLTSMVSELEGGGCYLNVGSAVILPEVFMKALTAARNLGKTVRDFVAVNFDMIQHYRPNSNVVHRPTLDGGLGYSFTGHHEILLPLLYHLLCSESD